MKRIIIATNEPFLTRMLKLALLRAGYLVDRAGHGEEAWTRLGDGRADALVASVDLARVSGLELARRLREAGRPTPVVLLRGCPGEEALKEADKLGQVRVIDEPVSPRHLLACLEALFGDEMADTFVGEPQAS